MTTSVEPSVGLASWELSALRHERLTAGAVLPTAAGPLWGLVLDGAVALETSAGTEVLGRGDAVLIDARTAYRLSGADDAEVAIADLRLVVPPSSVPSPLVVRDFAGRH